MMCHTSSSIEILALYPRITSQWCGYLVSVDLELTAELACTAGHALGHGVTPSSKPTQLVEHVLDAAKSHSQPAD
jgi:hypothetical protein